LIVAFKIPRKSQRISFHSAEKELITSVFITISLQALNRLEQQTSVPKAYGVIGVASVFVTCVFFNVAAGFLSNLLGWGLPAYFSIKALDSPGHQDDVQWLTYWVVFGFFTFIESFSTVIVAWYEGFPSLFFPLFLITNQDCYTIIGSLTTTP